MTFRRVLAADVVAMVAALALLFAMAADWYSTTAGEEARRIEGLESPRGAVGGEVSRAVKERARVVAEDAEKNAFQATGVVDRVILAGLLATVAFALIAGFLRAAGRRPRPPLTPSAAAAACAAVTAVLVVFRMIQEPGSDVSTTVESGAPLGLALLGVVALACLVALRAEEGGTAWRALPEPEPPAEVEPEPEKAGPGTAAQDAP